MAQNRDVQKLIDIFKRAESQLVREITRQQQNGFVDYHTTAQLNRVRKILQTMVSQSFKYIPKVIKEQFYLGKKLSAKLGYINTAKEKQKKQETLFHTSNKIDYNNIPLMGIEFI